MEVEAEGEWLVKSDRTKALPFSKGWEPPNGPLDGLGGQCKHRSEKSTHNPPASF